MMMWWVSLMSLQLAMEPRHIICMCHWCPPKWKEFQDMSLLIWTILLCSPQEEAYEHLFEGLLS